MPDRARAALFTHFILLLLCSCEIGERAM